MAKAGAGIAKQAAQKARLGYDAGYAAALKDAEGDYAAGYQAGLAQEPSGSGKRWKQWPRPWPSLRAIFRAERKPC